MTKNIVPPLFLIGLGQDSHVLVATKKPDVHLHLAGLAFACGLRLQARSDGDVILHALYNALSTAIGGGSLGPVGDQYVAHGEIDSRLFLQHVLKRVHARGYRVSNVAISIEAARPKLEKYFPMMKNSLAELLDVAPSAVGLAVTSGEGLTACGRGEGISVIATVLLIHN